MENSSDREKKESLGQSEESYVPYAKPEMERRVSVKYRPTIISTSAFRASVSSFPASAFNVVAEEVEDDSDGSVGFFKLFRYATCFERIALWTGIILSIIMGISTPVSVILYGEYTTLLVDRTVAVGRSTPTIFLKQFGGGEIITNGTEQQNYDAIIKDSLAYAASSVCLTIFMLVVGIASIDSLNYSALRQVVRVREMLLRAVLRQDMTWYDTNTSMNFASKVTDDMEKMKDGMGEKISMFTFLITSFLSGVVVAFFYGWKLTLVVMSSTPIIIIATAVVARVQSSLTVKELQAYGGAGMVAEEVLGAVRTVIAFGGQQKEINRYKEKLSPAVEMGSRKGLYSGIGSGIMWFIIYLSYAIAFYYGVTLIFNDRLKEIKEYTPAVLVIVFFGVLAGAQNLGMTSPHLDAFNSARGSAASIFTILDRKSEIDSLSKEGIIPNSLTGNILFENVHFSYPARPDVKILQGFNLRIPAGKTVALVGPSGCGKSTSLQLLQRMYSPAAGRVMLDGTDIKDINTKWLRQHIGVVSQEPILFATSIMENIRYGSPECSDHEIIAAARSANCHDFISKLPEGYGTLVGERGAQLSGGQKQRIAIARALLRKPQLLLLDEATSALDLHSQAKVQEALDAAIVGRTTLVISHRLSTITDADLIVFIDKGVVVEQGSHKQLMAMKANYYKLVMADVPDAMPDDKGDKPTPEEERVVMSRKSVYARASRASMRVSFAGNIPGSRISVASSVESVDDESLVKSADFCRILALNLPEWYLILFGCIASVALGATLPAFAFVFGDIYGVLSLDDRDTVLKSTLMYSMWFLCIGVISGVSTLIQMFVFGVSGSKLTARLRAQTFEAMLRQEMGWYDDETNSIGALSARLAGDCGAVQGATGTRIASILQAGSCLVISLIMALLYSWKMTLVSATTIPVILGAVFIEAAIMAGEGMREKVATENATKIATEAISNIKTVASLCQEEAFLSRYMMEINEAAKMAHTKTRLRGFVFSLGQCVPIFGYAISLSYGGYLIAEKEMEYKNVIKVSEALIFGSWLLGQALAFAPNFNSGKLSAARLFMLLDRIPKIASSPDCERLDDWNAKGDINYKKVEFSYPTRPGIEILRGLDLKIEKGTTVALVGHSGCGKSTCVQLIQRLYDPTWGIVTLDDMDIIENIPLDRLRAQLGLVSQEPVLFDRSIADNIAYGDNTREVPTYEIVSAAKQANIHNFVLSLPLGYDTRLGSKGTQLSGGQKQRIAIARALIRNPRVLLLDEATSALDTQSEKMVQEALDKAGAGRTCIVIAHRLSTIRNAHMICVVEKGKIAESGTHDELIQKDGLYAKLHAMQRMAL